jgi:Thoeris protein ThsB, TIR-like domain
MGGLLGMFGTEPPRNALADYVSSLTPKPEVSPMARAIANLLMDKPTPSSPVGPFGQAVNDLFFSSPKPAPPPYSFGNLGAVADLFPPAKPTLPVSPYTNALSGAVADLFPLTPRSSPFGSLAPPPSPPKTLYTPPAKPVAPSVKRKAFFSFHFPDSLRVNNVRNIWKIKQPSSANMRTFQDSSLWEARKLTDPKAIKAIIRYGVSYTSAVCVLIGTDTWSRRWVRYEIARAIIDGKGLLAVHLNSIPHHGTLTAHPLGRNPLGFMAIGKVQPNPSQPAKYILFEKLAVPDGAGSYQGGWIKYADHTDAVDLPAWVTDPAVGHVRPLSHNADEYDFMRDVGHKHIGSWLDRAAQRAGR